MDALGAFGAVIDVAERTMTLKSTQEVLALGVTAVQETYMTAMAVSVRLSPRGQALVMTNVIGEAADDATVLVEGSLGLHPTLCVSRTLCTVQKGQVIVEVCNASTDEYRIKKGTVVASMAVTPESAFESPLPPEERNPEEKHIERDVMASKPDIPSDKGVVADFPDSKLSEVQKTLFQEELNSFSDLIQQPYQVMGAEVEEYLDLGLIRPSNSPWASPVLMIRKPDGGIRFCIDYRRLNAVTGKDCYPMPLIDDILDVLGDAQLFSTMDIESGYWNVPMHENSVAKTAFTCKYGLYEWLQVVDWITEELDHETRRHLRDRELVSGLGDAQVPLLPRQTRVRRVRDHQALTWVFNPGNRTGNAKLARWAMELSKIQFNVHHKRGTAMGHVDGLSRLPMENVNALTMADLLNPERPNENGVPSSVGEPSEAAPEPEALRYASEPTEVETGETSATPVTPTSVDVLDWIRSLSWKKSGGVVDQGANSAATGRGPTLGSVPTPAYRADSAEVLCRERPADANRSLAGQCWTRPHRDCSGGAAPVCEHGVALLSPRLAFIAPGTD
ncbi:unnamed protein product [Phytophthora fragariaefolia]|uniref:Unnamed protein product n=1 Tax=Phytophthora fragariaefolia TaxID=1490495 RepID=A0A9W6Y0G0_9STRA|nr:unnamed protein product [Phytophthora fragariaefolia]